ncbi:MAG TPA: TRAP transporter large permease [Candidatus Blautia avistercoris]|nr:TRAP transporter large permease [Candidatus Blautia avistercoris]
MAAAVLFLIFIMMLIFAVPLAFAMGAAGSVAVLLDGNVDILGIVPRVFAGMNSVAMMAIPFFILSGSIMEAGNISKELVNFAKALVGHLRGGLAHVCVVSCMLFAAVSGSSVATALAFGNILVPAMNKDGYDKSFTATLQACGGTIGPIIPPSILMVMYCSIAGISVGSMFMAGVVPGILMGIALMIVSYFYAKKNNIPKSEKMPAKEKVRVILKAVWALLMPVIIIGGTMSGFCSPSEAGMLACIYGLIVGRVVYKGFRLKDLPEVFAKGALSGATILILNGMANIMGWQLARVNFPTMVSEFLGSITHSSLGVLFIVVIFLMILGMFMETCAATVIFAPVLYPMAIQFGIDPIQFGLVVVLTLVIGQITPPVGVLLSTTTSLIGVPMQSTFKYLVPCLISLLVVLVLCVLIPQFSLILPEIVY